MKILTFTSLFPNNVRPRQGVFVSERMAQVARISGCRVKVVAPVPYSPPLVPGGRSQLRQVAQREEIAGLDVHHPRYFMVPKVTMTSYGLTMFLSAAPLVGRIRRDFDFDVIDAHFLYPDGFAAVLLGRLYRRPVVVSARGSDVNVYGDRPVIRRLLRYTLQHADGAIAVSGALKRRMADHLGVPPGKIAVIPNGVDMGKFFREDRDGARRTLGLPGGRLLLSVGSLLPVKGFDLLIDAVKELVARESAGAVRLAIVGEGPERGALEARVRRAGLQDRVSFVGAVPHEKLRHWYSAADVLCLASRHEGCPNVVLEALACGTPVVASAVGGLPEILGSEHLGVLCGGGRRQLADGIGQALARRWDPALIASHVREHHSWVRAAHDVVAFFRRCVGSGSHRPSRDGGHSRETRLSEVGEQV